MSRRQEIQVGVTVLVALGVLLWGVTWLKELSLQRKVKVWHVVVPQTGGLGKSDEVQVNGIRKGSVSDIKLIGDHVMVDLALASDVTLTTDSRVAIRNVGLMGEKVIAVDLRATGNPYSDRDTIIGIYEKGMPEVMAEMGSTVDAISSLATQLQNVADAMEKSGNLNTTLTNFKNTSEELRLAVSENRAALKSTMDNFAAASRTAKSLTTDKEADLRKAMDHFTSAAERMDRLSTRLDSLRSVIHNVTEKVNSGDGTLGKLVNDKKLYTDASEAVQSVKALVEDIKANPKKYLTVKIF